MKHEGHGDYAVIGPVKPDALHAGHSPRDAVPYVTPSMTTFPKKG